MVDFHRKVGDTSSLTVKLTANDADALLGSAKKVIFTMSVSDDAEPKAEGLAQIVTASDGVVRYNFDEAEVDKAGIYAIEWEVTYEGGATQTFPIDYPMIVRFTESLN